MGFRFLKKTPKSRILEKTPTYERYSRAFAGISRPFAYVDMSLLEENIRAIRQRAGAKKIRIATKSVRCVEVLRAILAADPAYQGLMCFHLREAAWLASLGFDDLLVAYPSTEQAGLEAIAQQIAAGKTIYAMADHPAHLEAMQRVAAAYKIQMPVCLDLDMSSKLYGIYFGVWRSSVRAVADAQRFAEAIRKCPNLELRGLMGYEAQIAGLGDAQAGKALFSAVIRFLKRRSVREVAARRAAVVRYLQEAGFRLDFVNGGGTGSFETTRQEDCVTEIAAGSGFYSPTLFDHYQNFKHQPAAGFALEICRQPSADIFTCLGGGYVASGGVGVEKVPLPYLPKGCALDKNEMAGEVQTPIRYSGEYPLKVGDAVFFRHAKAGELCERFETLHLLQPDGSLRTTPTYRGENQCFV